MKKTFSAGAVVLNLEGKVLVISQHGTSWSLPKGHIEPGEDALAAAEREVREESGISQMTFVKKLGTYQRYKIGRSGEDDKSELKTITMFLAKTEQTELRPEDEDNPEARWVDNEDVEKLLTHPVDKEFFRSVRNKI